ncbi:1-deoxyxylulose-5-phosphate synthase YajO-like [Ptychodera flava]|uniref:1-deoxyxylulose-5-phosphate synthase YajO-like n=1 Tax=Ptychodera flava TaxID=63121 RepID=UPI00396A201A
MASAGIAKPSFNFVGSSGLRVSNLCLGAMTFGESKTGVPGQCDEDLSHQIMDRYTDLGGNFIDTANMYQAGTSEKYVGSWMAKRQNRNDLVISTKVRFPVDPNNENGRGLSRRHILQAVEESLQRLQTDYIDIYHVHCWDQGTRIEETLRTLDDLVRCGKVRYVGASNVTGWQLQKIVDECRRLGLNPWICLQAQYSLLCRSTEFELTDVCRNEGLGLLPWSPLKGGWLTGKVGRSVKPPEGSRLAYVEANPERRSTGAWPSYKEFAKDEQVLQLLDIMEKIGKEVGKTMSQIAIRWLLQKDTVSAVVIGAKTLQQLDDNMGASGWELTQQQMDELDEASKVEPPYPYEIITKMGKDRKRENSCR